MKRLSILSKAVVIAIALPVVACSASPTHSGGAEMTVGSAPRTADPPSNIMNKDEYEHSPSYPPG
jgi:hypothetical protein